MFNPWKKKKVPEKMVKLLYDTYLRGHTVGSAGLREMSFETFKDQLQQDFNREQAKKKG